ncbi:MAG: hypothetical protein ACM3PT_09645 [Deltaproteobacteria bacterium]
MIKACLNILYLFLIPLMILPISCGIDFQKAQSPHYLYIKNIDLTTKPQSEGAPSHKISDLWIYADGKLAGTFSKNRLIPIIHENENVKISIVAGIRTNGNKQDFQQYFLLNSIDFDIIFSEGKIDTLDALFSYSKNSRFVFIEDFENGNIFTVDIDKNPSTSVSISKNDVHSGLNCGKIILDKTNNTIEVTSSAEFFQLPLSGNSVYLELDYKCSTNFVIGLTGKENSNGKEYNSDVILLTKKENWNKLYLNLTDIIRKSGLGLYKIYFRAEHDNTNEKSEISLDNIKLIYLAK